MSDETTGSDTPAKKPPAGKPGPAPERPVGDAALNEEAEKNEEGIDRSKTPGRTFDV